MTDKITDPIAPDVDNPAPHTILAGDYNDDDAMVYEEDFAPADHGPEKVAGVPHKVETIKPTTRLLNAHAHVGTINGSLQDPLLLLPADPNRVRLLLTVAAPTAVVYADRHCVISSTKSDCFGGGTIQVSPDYPVVMDLSGHTGAVWAYSTSTGDVTVTVTAVTS